MKIDIVYLWVDGNDPIWQKKKKEKAKEVGKIIPESISSARSSDNNELKYSLRSTEKYAAWVNQIFIITDNQIPEWLNTENPKINVIDLSEIIPGNFLPTFNSCVIENHIHKIKDLSEHFIYFNDDMFLGNYSTQKFFFTEKGQPRIFVSEFTPTPNKKLFDINLRSPEKRNSYQYNMVNARILVFKKYKKKTYRIIRHSIKPLLKSRLFELDNIFKNEILATNKNNFRTNNDILLTYLFEFYAIVENIGKTKYLITSDVKSAFNKFLTVFYDKYTFGYINLHENDIQEHFQRILNAKPFTFCLNQTHETPQDHIKYEKQFLQNYFPEKSSFEK